MLAAVREEKAKKGSFQTEPEPRSPAKPQKFANQIKAKHQAKQKLSRYLLTFLWMCLSLLVHSQDFIHVEAVQLYCTTLSKDGEICCHQEGILW